MLPLNKSDKPQARDALGRCQWRQAARFCWWPSRKARQISIYLQKPDGTLDAPKTFSTLTGVSDLAVSSNWATNGKPSIFLLSTDERQIGVAQLDR